MKGIGISIFLGLAGLVSGPVDARAPLTCGTSNSGDCVLEAIWNAASILPSEKRDRLVEPFLETVALSGDADLVYTWRQRLKAAPPAPLEETPYARQKARLAIASGDWDRFLSDARSGRPPFNIGRPEIMAEGARLARDRGTRQRVIDAMFDLAGPPQTAKGLDRSFEQADFGHVLAELAMEACDLAGFDRAVALTAEPDSLRHALWRSRITGDAEPLAARILAEADAEDTRHVRSALDGYAPILERGYCP